MKRKYMKAAVALLLLLLASAFGAGALALSGSDPLLYADLDRADFEFCYTPQANSNYAVYLFSQDGDAVYGRVEIFENGNLLVEGEGSGAICGLWLTEGVEYTVRVHGSGSAVIEVARQALSRSSDQPLTLSENESFGKMIAHEYDAHWYTFEASSDAPALIACVPENTEMRLNALIFDADGTLISEFEHLSGGACKLRFETETGASYFIRISAPDGDVGYYTLQAHRSMEDEEELLAFDAAEHILPIHGKLELSAEVGNALLWVSDDPWVAGVTQDGTVIGLQAGETVVTAYGLNTQASCRIIVEYIPLESIHILGEELTLGAGDDIDVQIELVPENASDRRLRYQVDDREIASVSREGILKALQSGETTLRVSTPDGSISDSIRVRVTSAVRKYRALLVSEQNYPYSENNERIGSQASMQGIEQLLESARFETAAYSVRTREDLSRSELIAEIRSAFKSASVQDISLLYITCHGSYSGGMSFLELSDGSNLSARDLERELRHISGTVIVLVDCCGSGGVIGKASERVAFAKGITGAFSASNLRGNKYKVIASAGLDEDSFRIAFSESSDSSVMATVFARALCDGAGWDIDLNVRSSMNADIDYDGRISMGELASYMTERVDWYLNSASELTDGDYRQSIQVYPEGDPLILFERRS